MKTPRGENCTLFILRLMMIVLMTGVSGPSQASPEFSIDRARVLIDTATCDVQGPGALCRAEDGGLLVTDLAGRSLLCFDSNGELKWKTDATGTGEQGFLQPRQVSTVHGTSIFVLDTGLRKILKFDRRGAFAGYVASEEVHIPSALAQGPGGELYIYDSATWSLVCLSPAGTLRWKVKPWKMVGEPSSIRIAGGEIHLFVPEEWSIYSYGKFGEFLRKTKIAQGSTSDDGNPTAFWKAREGYMYVSTDRGLLLVFDQFGNPAARLSSLHSIELEQPCDLSVRGKTILLLDCGRREVLEITAQ